MNVVDLPELLVIQERGAAIGLSNVFPQNRYPFPRDMIRDRRSKELHDKRIAAYVAIATDSLLVGFAARQGDEVLHFGTSPALWRLGMATWMHDALVATYPLETRQLRLRVFVENRRARRCYEKQTPAYRAGQRSHPTRLWSNTPWTAVSCMRSIPHSRRVWLARCRASVIL